MNDITYVGKLTMKYSVSRHAHESWEFVYCTGGSGAFGFDGGTLEYREGDVVIIPPMVPHTNGSEGGFQNIHINMVSPSLSYNAPRVVSDDTNHFLLDAFNAAYFQFYSDRKEAAALLSLYGDLICCYLAAYRTGVHRHEHTAIGFQEEIGETPPPEGDGLNIQVLHEQEKDKLVLSPETQDEGRRRQFENTNRLTSK